MKWTYGTETVSGNLHSVAHYLNTNHPEWDVVAAHQVGLYVVILYRVEAE